LLDFERGFDGRRPQFHTVNHANIVVVNQRVRLQAVSAEPILLDAQPWPTSQGQVQPQIRAEIRRRIIARRKNFEHKKICRFPRNNRGCCTPDWNTSGAGS
jgi:hypothetical protein